MPTTRRYFQTWYQDLPPGRLKDAGSILTALVAVVLFLGAFLVIEAVLPAATLIAFGLFAVLGFTLARFLHATGQSRLHRIARFEARSWLASAQRFLDSPDPGDQARGFDLRRDTVRFCAEVGIPFPSL